MGPTAAGKTELALDLVKNFPLEIISVDSAQVYRGMDIGTAKPSAELLAAVPHHLVDIREPADKYSAGAFTRDAVTAMQEITAKGRIPLLAGGTMLYFRALQRGIAPLPQADATLRSGLDARAAREGWPALHAELASLDPATAERLQPNDAQRIQRALEVCMLTGVPLSALHADTAPPVVAEYLNIALIPSDRQLLHERIAARLRQMVEDGFVEEMRGLAAAPDVSEASPAMRAVGYRQMWPYLRGQSSLDECMEQAIIATRRLAKRQLTWLRSWPQVRVVDSLSDDAVEQVNALVKQWLKSDASGAISG
jgi:tRNA dimethylallyltransferase